MPRWLMGSLFVLASVVFLSASQGKEKPIAPGELYDAGMELYYQGKYDAAIETFSQLIQSFPASQSVSFSVYMIGQCYFATERYDEATRQFALYLRSYPDGFRVKEAEQGLERAREGARSKRAPKATPAVPAMQPVTEAKRTKRRICSQVFYLEAKNLEEVDKRFKDLRRAGVDTVILRAFQSRGDRRYKFIQPQHEEGVYFKTASAPVVNDILGTLTELAHRNELEVFAWITTRYADYGMDGTSGLRGKSYNFETKQMEGARGFTLFHPEAVKRLEGLFRDLGRYPIEGILFQDDLILKHNEDFGAEASKTFLKEFGYAPHPDLFYVDPYRSASGKYYVRGYTERFWEWAHWKNRWLMDVAQRLMGAARESNPNLEFGLNLYYEAVLNSSNGLAWFSQSLSEAMRKNFDYYAVMAYHRQTMRELNLEGKEAIQLMGEVTRKAIGAVGDPSQVMMKLQVIDWKTYEAVPAKELDDLVTGILGQGRVSLAFVPYVEPNPLHSIKARWNASLNPPLRAPK